MTHHTSALSSIFAEFSTSRRHAVTYGKSSAEARCVKHLCAIKTVIESAEWSNAESSADADVSALHSVIHVELHHFALLGVEFYHRTLQPRNGGDRRRRHKRVSGF